MIVRARERRPAGTVAQGRPGTTRRVLAGIATYLAARTFVLRAFHPVPVLLGGDQGFFWMYGERMLRGEVPCRDFFQFTPPGADVVHLVAFALFGGSGDASLDSADRPPPGERPRMKNLGATRRVPRACRLLRREEPVPRRGTAP